MFAAEDLRERGWNVYWAKDGFEAMVLFETENFGLIVSDIRMPNLSGDQLMSWLQTEGRFAHTHVIACTAHAQADDVRRMQGAGFDMVLIGKALEHIGRSQRTPSMRFQQGDRGDGKSCHSNRQFSMAMSFAAICPSCSKPCRA